MAGNNMEDFPKIRQIKPAIIKRSKVMGRLTFQPEVTVLCKNESPVLKSSSQLVIVISDSMVDVYL